MRSRRSLIGITILLLGWMLAIVISGGFVTEIGGVRVSSRNPKRPFVAYAVLLLLYAWRFGANGLAADLAPLTAVWRRLGTRTVVGAAVLVGIVGVAFGTHVASGADAYGYVSQAALWRQGSLHVSMPLSEQLPWPNATWSVSPLGYRPDLIPNHIVPTYAPGLPLMMAGASFLHPSATYWVVPVLGAILTWVTYRLGRAYGDHGTGVLAAFLMATSPVFFHQLVVPMSDVPAAAFWTTSILLTLTRNTGSWLAAGLCAAMAVLVRPNTVPLALAPLLVFALEWIGRRPVERLDWRLALAYLAGIVPGAAFIAVVNASLYGSPFLSGYGQLGELYSWRYTATNVARFSRWLVQSETAVILFAGIGAIALWRRGQRQHVGLAAAVMALVTLCYVFYLPFDNWTFLRFLLPAMPIAFVLCAVGTIRSYAGLPIGVRTVAAIIIVGAAFVWRLDLARVALDFRHSEHRYVAAARYVADQFPQNAVFLTMQHSGSLRHYSGRLTVRWDGIEPEWFDRAPDVLRRAGYDPYILVEEAELSDFRARLGPRSRLGRLDWKPLVELPLAQTVRIFDPDDADR